VPVEIASEYFETGPNARHLASVGGRTAKQIHQKVTG
jgi:hypothetical protein